MERMGKDGKDRKRKQWKNKLEINIIIVRKLNYLKNDAELDGR